MDKDKDYERYNLTRLQTELEEERVNKEMLEVSVSDLRSSVCELHEGLCGVDREGNEWKTRFETQEELNRQLEKQISLTEQKLDNIRGDPIDRLAFVRSYDDMAVEALKERLEVLMEEKRDLQRELRDCHLQVELEGKAFHKANDERRAYQQELSMLSSNHGSQRGHRSSQQNGAPESKLIRVKQTRKKTHFTTGKGKRREKQEFGVNK